MNDLSGVSPSAAQRFRSQPRQQRLGLDLLALHSQAAEPLKL
jgi:hypothetical protein